MDPPWTVHGTAMEVPWTVHRPFMTPHGRPIVGPWTAHGPPWTVPMDFFHGEFMNCRRTSVHGLAMDPPWTVHGPTGEEPVTVHGPTMAHPWTVQRQSVDPPWTSCRSPRAVHGYTKTQWTHPCTTMDCSWTVYGPPWSTRGLSMECLDPWTHDKP